MPLCPFCELASCTGSGGEEFRCACLTLLWEIGRGHINSPPTEDAHRRIQYAAKLTDLKRRNAGLPTFSELV